MNGIRSAGMTTKGRIMSWSSCSSRQPVEHPRRCHQHQRALTHPGRDHHRPARATRLAQPHRQRQPTPPVNGDRRARTPGPHQHGQARDTARAVTPVASAPSARRAAGGNPTRPVGSTPTTAHDHRGPRGGRRATSRSNDNAADGWGLRVGEVTAPVEPTAAASAGRSDKSLGVVSEGGHDSLTHLAFATEFAVAR
jgi:hypothetical protein